MSASLGSHLCLAAVVVVVVEDQQHLLQDQPQPQEDRHRLQFLQQVIVLARQTGTSSIAQPAILMEQRSVAKHATRPTRPTLLQHT